MRVPHTREKQKAYNIQMAAVCVCGDGRILRCAISDHTLHMWLLFRSAPAVVDAANQRDLGWFVCWYYIGVRVRALHCVVCGAVVEFIY